jgi:hypothetical protein
MWTPTLITRMKRKNEKKKQKESVTIEDYLTIEIKNIIITLIVMVDKNLKTILRVRVNGATIMLTFHLYKQDHQMVSFQLIN